MNTLEEWEGRRCDGDRRAADCMCNPFMCPNNRDTPTPDERRRHVHEAGHLLCGHLVGLDVASYTASAGAGEGASRVAFALDRVVATPVRSHALLQLTISWVERKGKSFGILVRAKRKRAKREQLVSRARR